MGSSFENLVVTSSTVKTDFKSAKPFGLQHFLKFQNLHLMQDYIILSVCLCMHAKGAISLARRAYG